jgi:hypothetical protein
VESIGIVRLKAEHVEVTKAVVDTTFVLVYTVVLVSVLLATEVMKVLEVTVTVTD